MTFDYDLVGVGFGPSNMALAVALEDYREALRHRSTQAPVKAVFFDRAPHSQWHQEMLIPGATMQVSHLKDLATLRNPSSAYTFTNFLHQHGRLMPFINRGATVPLRSEFNAYLSWAASALKEYVQYHHEVTRIRPIVTTGRIAGYAVTVAHADRTVTVTTKHVVQAPGLEPQLPTGIALAPRIRHNQTFLADLRKLPVAELRDVIVVGAGQSAAEVILHLTQIAPQLNVHVVLPNAGLQATEQSPYANEIFNPEMVDYWYEAAKNNGEAEFANHRNTNYATVNPDTIQRLYDEQYTQYWSGEQRIHWHPFSRLVSAAETANQVTASIRSARSDTDQKLTADALFLATGYQPVDPTKLCAATDLLRRGADGEPLLRRGFSVRQKLPDDGRFFMVGCSEAQHGLSTTLLSVIAPRAGEILAQVTAGVDMRPTTVIR